MVVELTVVVVPLTVKFPDNVTLPENVCPAKASDFSSEADTELAAICSESTALSANFAEVTASVVSLAVLIAPVAILPPVIVVSAIWSAVTCPSSMCFVR